MANPKPLRQTMPTVAAWIDALREVFGAAEINAAIRAANDGQDTFYACENGHDVGTRPSPPAFSVSGDALFAHLPFRPADTPGARP